MENDVVEDVADVVADEIGAPVESSSSEADMVAEYIEDGGEITYDVDSQAVFKTDLSRFISSNRR